jgi:hypothetical protein
MKYLITILLFTSFAQAKPVCNNKESFNRYDTTAEAYTTTPKTLQGATYTITKANGSTETVKADEYMLVKRKHLRPVIINNTNNTISCTEDIVTNVVPEDQKYSKNIVSLKVIDGYGDVNIDRNPLQTKLSVDRQVGVGFQYQRAWNNKFYFLGEVDTNQGLGFGAGVGF